MSTKRFLFSAIMLALSAILVMPAAAQSLTSGDITGVVTDPTGAVVANATVTAKNAETGTTQTQNTNAQGAYRFCFRRALTPFRQARRTFNRHSARPQ